MLYIIVRRSHDIPTVVAHFLPSGGELFHFVRLGGTLRLQRPGGSVVFNESGLQPLQGRPEARLRHCDRGHLPDLDISHGSLR